MPAKEEKIPLSQVKKLPYQSLNRMIKKMREYLKKNEVVQKMFKEYGVDISEIDLIPMMFGHLDVSAKTDHGVIIYNYRLLTDGDFFKDFSYGVHEMTHWLQQTTGNKATKSSDDGNYLDNPYEQEGFQNQVEYISDQFGKDEAEQYVDDLLEHHEVDNKKEIEEKKEVLMANAEAARSPEEIAAEIKRVKNMIQKYHPDNRETADPDKFKMLKDRLRALQNYAPPVQSLEPEPPTKGHQLGDWYDKYISSFGSQ
jgi:hypothetical protein